MTDDRGYDVLRDAMEVAARAIEEPEDRDLTQTEKALHGVSLIDDLTAAVKKTEMGKRLVENGALVGTIVMIPFNVPGFPNYSVTIENNVEKDVRTAAITDTADRFKVRISGKQYHAPLITIDYFPAGGEPIHDKLHGLLKGQQMIGNFKKAIGI